MNIDDVLEEERRRRARNRRATAAARWWWTRRRAAAAEVVVPFADAYSMAFDGVDEYGHNTSAYTAIAGTGKTALTVACWFKTPATLAAEYLFSMHKSAAAQVDGFSVSITAGGVVELNANGHATATLSTTLSTSTWYGLVMRYNGALAGAARLRGWLCEAGSSLADDTSSSAAAATLDLNYGSGQVVVAGKANLSGSWWSSRVSELGIWDAALSDAQIAALEDGGLPTDMTEVGTPEVVWRMGDTDGDSATGTVLDATGNGHSLTMVNMESGDLVEDAPSA